MRFIMFVVAGALALVPVPAMTAPAAKPIVILAGNMLGFGPGKAASASFGTAKAKALGTASAALGKPVEQGTYRDCGQGIAIGYARFRGGLELTFIAGKFVGWAVGEGGSKAFRTARGVTLGSPRIALKKAYPAVTIDPDTSLGVMFSIDDDLGGFLDSDTPTARVAALQAGQVCMIS